MSKDNKLEQVWSILIDRKRSIRSIQKLAEEYGFDDLTEFNRVFREKYGSSPVAIRKAAKGRKVRFGGK